MTQTKNKRDKPTQVEVSTEDDGVQPTTIRLPPKLLEVLDADAERCKRNRSRQLEALLEAFYFGVNTDIPADRLQEMAKASSFKPPASPQRDRYDATAYVEPGKKRGEK